MVVVLVVVALHGGTVGQEQNKSLPAYPAVLYVSEGTLKFLISRSGRPH